MSTEIKSSLISTSPDENNLFFDVLHEVPLSGHRKPMSLIGSIFYCFLLASFAILAVRARWIFHPMQRLVFPLLSSCNLGLLVVTGGYEVTFSAFFLCFQQIIRSNSPSFYRIFQTCDFSLWFYALNKGV
ncbi:protein FIP1-like [Capsicum annuum]|uniref:protein FIP1-like n=1 Tax=Capsicum annuum TaxID=4072 RepID=UPI001FB0DE78|nr:protein FIP1-like [Capsicum annuum]